MWWKCIRHVLVLCLGMYIICYLLISPCFSLFADQSGMPPSSLSLCSEPRVTQFIRQFVASCLLVSDSNTELSYILPSEAVRKGSFERLFQVNTPRQTLIISKRTIKEHSFNVWYRICYSATTELTVNYPSSRLWNRVWTVWHSLALV